ncbi:MAG: hypothetical protein A2W80_15820 [Candidatus Riflebacteria bacterium GWC2_50_8]|nr:MAG: hypothetical protein A2W80_15820 [Candidatus Riflebacteria bacterium GWC2_50_8]
MNDLGRIGGDLTQVGSRMAPFSMVGDILCASTTVMDVYEAILYYACYATGSIGGFISTNGHFEYFDMVVGSYRKRRLGAKGGIKIYEYPVLSNGEISQVHNVWVYKSGSTGWVMGLETPERPDVNLLESINLIAKGAIGFVRRFEEEVNTKDRDQLTGLFNRGRFYRDLKHLAGTFAHNGKSLWLLFIDLNNFKVINDTFGHKMGDRVLQSQSFAISRSVADAGMTYRYGGDEFCVILPGRDEHEVKLIVRRIELASEQAPGGITVSASVGFALYQNGEDLEAFVARADTEMYDAKRLIKEKKK